MGLTELVRDSCRAVVENAELVTIDDERLRAYGAELVRELAERSHDTEPPGVGWSDDPEVTAGLVLALGTINFGSGYHDVVAKLPWLSGARSMAAHLRAEIERRGAIEAGWLQALGGEDCARIFGQDPNHPEQRELMALFAEALRDLGRFVADGFDGSFVAVVEGADGSAERLAESLVAMPFFDDRTELNGRTVWFHKRAQITAADMARAFGYRPPAQFGDLDELTCFADNLVPHVLRVDGVLCYDPELAARIDRGERLEHGSRAEIEIRAAGVEAVERLVAGVAEGLSHRRPVVGLSPVRAMDLDLVLWGRGASCRYKAVRRHRSRCVYY